MAKRYSSTYPYVQKERGSLRSVFKLAAMVFFGPIIAGAILAFGVWVWTSLT